ncbi:MAG: hypothetical protein ACK6DP_00135 [Gemmatimonas sp.]|jgi:hypothetical protein|uniref:hypothetical protein n=1 Tax=Gemmatimonas sp. TaxID=1962908 RepID=UPI00391F612D|nr:hypothetical protein [Gemmatimonadota bacterium]
MPKTLLRWSLTLLTATLLPFGAADAKAQGAPPAAGAPTAVPPARQADVASLDAILTALYEVISGPAGQRRDWDRFRSLFMPGARLIPTSGQPGRPAVALAWSPDEYVQRAAPGLERDGFFEREIGRRVDTFGRITQVFSAYDSRRTPTDTRPFQRGINSIQLLNDGTRWWVVSVYWDTERPDNPIPRRYLTKGGGR